MLCLKNEVGRVINRERSRLYRRLFKLKHFIHLQICFMTMLLHGQSSE